MTGNDASENAAGSVNLLLIGLASFSTAYNIVLYIIFNPSFKQAIQGVLRCANKNDIQQQPVPNRQNLLMSPLYAEGTAPVATDSSRLFTMNVKSHFTSLDPKTSYLP